MIKYALKCQLFFIIKLYLGLIGMYRMIFHMTSIVAIQLPGRRQIDIARSHKFRGQPIAHFKFPWWLWYDWLVQPWIKLFNKSVLTLDALALEHIELPTSFKGLESGEVLYGGRQSKMQSQKTNIVFLS